MNLAIAMFLIDAASLIEAVEAEKNKQVKYVLKHFFLKMWNPFHEFFLFD